MCVEDKLVWETFKWKLHFQLFLGKPEKRPPTTAWWKENKELKRIFDELYNNCKGQ